MTIADTMPAFTFPSREVLRQAARGENLHLAGTEGIWYAETQVICRAFSDLMALLSNAEGVIVPRE